jgi:gamma-glutamyltranspeptidase/glutathione hydrolase
LRTSDRNAAAPGKRPLSSMAPTIVLDSRGQPLLTLGASGGPRIISSVLGVLIDVLDYEMPLGEAIQALRIHHQWMPDEVAFSEKAPEDLIEGLKKRGHRIGKQYSAGVVQAVEWQKDNTLLGASDPRKGGRPAGY